MNGVRAIRSSLFLCIAVLVIGLLLFGCSAGRNAQLPTAEHPLRVACIGNSITYGDGIQDREHKSYPAQLQTVLGPGWVVRNFGSSGRTLLRKGDYPYRNEKIFTDAKSFLPDIVIIKLGTNDSKPWNWKYKDEYVQDYIDLVHEFEKLPSQPKVYVCTPVPAFPGNWGITDSVIHLEVVPRVLLVAQATGVPVIDLYRALTGRSDLFPDSVHPNEEGARLIAREVLKNICPQCSKLPQ